MTVRTDSSFVVFGEVFQGKWSYMRDNQEEKLEWEHLLYLLAVELMADVDSPCC